MAEELLLAWHNMLPVEANKRAELSTQLANKKEINSLVSRISAASDAELENLTRNLLTENPLIKNAVMLVPEIQDKLLNWYQSTVEKFIGTSQYNSIVDILSQAKNIFSEDKAKLQRINDLEKRVEIIRTKKIQSLADRYSGILSQEELHTQDGKIDFLLTKEGSDELVTGAQTNRRDHKKRGKTKKNSQRVRKKRVSGRRSKNKA